MKASALRIAAPCPEDWEAMTGDARGRYCARCELHVHDVSELREAEVEALLARRDERLCVRTRPDGAGAVVTRTTQERRFLDALRALAARREEGPR
jgi:hypothetical protein